MASKEETAYRIDPESLAHYAAQTGRKPAPRPLARLLAFPGAPEITPLPEPLSSFIGRNADVSAVLALLADPAARLITLTGPGGIGKTRLSLAVASDVLADQFPDGIVFIPLADLQSPQMVMPAIAHALGLQERPGQSQTDRLRAFLRRKALLLVLDNFEHLLAVAPEVAALLTEAPRVQALVTSRAALRAMGERERPIQPMTVASNNATAAELLASDAGRLFAERAREHDPSFSIDAESAPLVADICAQLDGLPLAIELAAAQVKVLSLPQINARLERWLPLLMRGLRNAPSRHSTMRDAIAWSFDLLSPEEQRLFQRLAIFPAGATLEAAECVGGEGGTGGGEIPDGELAGRHGANDSPPLSPCSPCSPFVLETITSLTEQSLLMVETGLDGQRRFRMLETIREFGLEQLASAGDEDEARAALASYMLALVASFGASELLAANKPALDRLEASHSDLQSVLSWLESRDPAAFTRLVAMLPAYWYACSHYQVPRTGTQIGEQRNHGTVSFWPQTSCIAT